ASVLEHALDELPGEARGRVGKARAKRTALPGFLRVSPIEVDLEERLQRDATRWVAAGALTCGVARDLRGHAAGTAAVPIASTRRVVTARSATAMAQRIMLAFARPWVTTDTPAMPRSGADTYGS